MNIFIDGYVNKSITRKRVSTFEHKVKKIDDINGYIDLIWKGTTLIEMKSRGKIFSRTIFKRKRRNNIELNR